MSRGKVVSSYPSHKAICAKVVLPPGENNNLLFKIEPRGRPPKPTITSIAPNCPHKVEVGQTICAIGVNDEFILDPTPKFLYDVTNEFNFSDQRTLLLQRSPTHVSGHGNNGREVKSEQNQRHPDHHHHHPDHHHHHHHKSQTSRSASAKELNAKSNSTQKFHAKSRSAKQLRTRSSSAKALQAPRASSTKRLRASSKQQSGRRIAPATRPGPGKVSLPCGHVGLWFEGSPAILTDVSEGSPVASEARGKVGLAVTAMKIPGEVEMYGPLTTDELVELLNDFSDVEGRMLVFDRIHAATRAKEVVSKIYLPTRDFCIQFSGKHPLIKVCKVTGDSQTVKKIKVGQVVRRLEFPGEAPYFSSVGARTLNVLLEHHEKTRGKVMVVGYPFKLNSTSSNEEEVAAERIEENTLANSIRRSFHEWKRQTSSR